MDRTALEARAQELERKLSDPLFLSNPREAKKAGSELQKIGELLKLDSRIQKLREELKEAETMGKETDPEARSLGAEEAGRLRAEIESAAKELEELESPGEQMPDGLIMEIRAGTGGEEAALFAKNLFDMYSRYAAGKGWKLEMLSSSESEMGGIKEIVFEIEGKGTYRALRRESGVHRIQRIPKTEKQGRIHTSTASVAVLPKAEETEVEIKPQDVAIDFFRASGPGGQNVNKVESAVRITHTPTGIVVASQEGRSQQKNRERAMGILRAKLYELQREAEEKKMAAERKSQIGTGDRSEKIRTYNVPQDRVTDHRANQSWHHIESIFGGEIEPIISALSKLR